MAQSQTLMSSAPNFAVDQGLEYYAGKSELLDWVNRLLDLNLMRLEQLTSGAVYCQILDAFYADVVALRKVNFLAREEYEIVPNYKVLQAAFNALGFTKELDVAKLSRASSPDLMEFAQWLYKSAKGVSTLPGYNPAARRQLSMKGGTNNIPFPACVVNSSFEFSRSDLRSSGTWATGTPQDQGRTAARTQRSLSNTPATGGKLGVAGSGAKGRTPSYLNVTSRYREGLAVPPDHYERRSPRLSPGSTGPNKRATTSHGGTQTDFEDEEYPPMSAAAVGHEAVSPREARDAGPQLDGGFGFGESSASPSGAALISHGLADHTFSFGQPRAAGKAASPAASLSPSPSGQALATADPEEEGIVDMPATPAPQSTAASDTASRKSLRDAAIGPDSDDEQPQQHWSAARAEAEAAANTASLGASARPAGGASDGGLEEAGSFDFEDQEAAVSTTHGEFELEEAAPPDAFGFATTAASRGAADEGRMASEASSAAADDAAGAAAIVETAPRSGGKAGVQSATADEGTPLFNGAVTSPAPPSSAGASPSPRTAPWRSSGNTLPADVASLLASPAARTRLASSSCLRDMSAALDVCAAALQAADKSVDSYTALLATAPTGAGSGADAGSDAGSAVDGPACSAALCGKARSLQDALQTLLAHTKLLLSDVQAYSEATHPQPQSAPSSRGGAEASASPGKALVGPADGGAEGAAARNFLAEAAALLEIALSHEGRLTALIQKANDVLQLPPASAGSEPLPGVSSGPSAGASAPAPAGSAVAHRHLTDEQRKLCSTAMLDGHLKAVGIAQFALVQDIHKELAALTSTYFRHTGITGGGDASTGGADGSTGGVSTGSNRKARVFKLGEYQLKQLRNGDIYKGRYVCNKKNGEGVYHFINADVYEGEFRDDRMDGYGVYTFSHEGRYEGQWRNAVYNGTGAETFAKGSTYHGEYAGGLRNGWGVCRFYNGDYYEGQWAKGLRDGSGMQQCTDDSNFVGDYHRGKRHGHGVYSFPNGDRYEGQYSEDLPHGHGTYHFASGQCYQGQWSQGKKHGWSVYTVDNGSRFMGLWSEGKPTWVQPLNGDVAASNAAANPTDDSGRSLKQALEARDQAVQAAADARTRAAGHWGVDGLIQSRLHTSLSQAQTSASMSQQARRKACDLAGRLDAAVALLQTQGAGAPVASATP